MIWTLSEAFDVPQVVAAHEQALGALDHDGGLEIDGRAVRRADAAAVQLLLAVVREADARQASCALHASDELSHVIRTLGLSAVLRQATMTPPATAGV